MVARRLQNNYVCTYMYIRHLMGYIHVNMRECVWCGVCVCVCVCVCVRERERVCVCTFHIPYTASNNNYVNAKIIHKVSIARYFAYLFL